MTAKTGKPRGRPPGPIKKTVQRVAAADSAVRGSKRFKAYVRMVGIAEEIDRELALAYERNPQKPTEIRDCQDRLVSVLKNLIPYEKPRLSAVKVSGDKNAPLFDLRGLGEKELLLLRRIILKSKQIGDREQDAAEDEEE